MKSNTHKCRNETYKEDICKFFDSLLCQQSKTTLSFETLMQEVYMMVATFIKIGFSDPISILMRNLEFVLSILFIFKEVCQLEHKNMLFFEYFIHS